MGPTTAETPLNSAVEAIAMPVCSGWPFAQSKAALYHVDEKPPFYDCSRRSVNGLPRAVGWQESTGIDGRVNIPVRRR